MEFWASQKKKCTKNIRKAVNSLFDEYQAFVFQSAADECGLHEYELVNKELGRKGGQERWWSMTGYVLI